MLFKEFMFIKEYKKTNENEEDCIPWGEIIFASTNVYKFCELRSICQKIIPN